MTRQEIEKIKERVKTNAIQQKAHLFSIAYSALQETLKSTDLSTRGFTTSKYWPSYWDGKNGLSSKSLSINNVDGKMRVSIN